MTASAPRAPASSRHVPLSRHTRKRLLLAMLARADAGDLDAAAALIRLSIDVDENRQRKHGAERMQMALS